MRHPAIGTLRRKVALEAPARAAGEGGAGVITWSTIATAWAQIAPRVGREIVAADGLGGRVTHDIRLRWRASITPAMRFKLGTRLFDIRAVRDEDERRRWLVCLCEERVP